MAAINWAEFFASDDQLTMEHVEAAFPWCSCALHELRPDLLEPNECAPGGLGLKEDCPLELMRLGISFNRHAVNKDKAGMKRIYEAIRDWKDETE